MNIFLFAYVAISSLGLGLAISEHGQERKPGNIWNAIVAFIVGQFLVWGIYLTK